VALKILQSKLWKLDIEKKHADRRNSTLGLGDNSWGNQIRSVVLHPYTLVKDHRTSWETNTTTEYLKGNQLLHSAMKAYLLHGYGNDDV
jgi:peptide chain release factor 2